MKFVPLVIVMIAAGLIGAGCASLLKTSTSADSYPVSSGVATTNQSPLTAWLEVAQATNKAVNVTPSQLPIETILGAFIGLSAAASGWYARHQTQKAVDKVKPPA